MSSVSAPKAKLDGASDAAGTAQMPARSSTGAPAAKSTIWGAALICEGNVTITKKGRQASRYGVLWDDHFRSYSTAEDFRSNQTEKSLLALSDCHLEIGEGGAVIVLVHGVKLEIRGVNEADTARWAQAWRWAMGESEAAEKAGSRRSSRLAEFLEVPTEQPAAERQSKESMPNTTGQPMSFHPKVLRGGGSGRAASSSLRQGETPTLGTESDGRRPAADRAASGSGLKASRSVYSDFKMPLQSLLDAFSMCPPQLQLVRQALLSSHKSAEDRVRAVAGALPEARRVDEELLNRVSENLRQAGWPLPPATEAALGKVLELHDRWTFDWVDNAPKLDSPDSNQIRLSSEELDAVRRVAFATTPMDMLSRANIDRLWQEEFFGTRRTEQPVAIVTVGPPGCGKGTLLFGERNALRAAQAQLDVPPVSECIHIDPDYWLSRLCHNENSERPLCNFMTMCSFQCAVARGRHIVFDGTGKDTTNTCGRIISRMKEAGYRVIMTIVLASFDTCMERVQRRRQDFGRDVPRPFVREVFKDLQSAVEVYLRRHAEVADAVLLYDSEPVGKDAMWVASLEPGSSLDEVETAVSYAQKLLALPDETANAPGEATPQPQRGSTAPPKRPQGAAPSAPRSSSASRASAPKPGADPSRAPPARGVGRGQALCQGAFFMVVGQEASGTQMKHLVLHEDGLEWFTSEQSMRYGAPPEGRVAAADIRDVEVMDGGFQVEDARRTKCLWYCIEGVCDSSSTLQEWLRQLRRLCGGPAEEADPEPPRPGERQEDPQLEEELMAAFRDCDRDGSGHVNKRELILAVRKHRHVADLLGLQQKVKQTIIAGDGKEQVGTRTLFERVFQQMDEDESGDITSQEFVSFCKTWRHMQSEMPGRSSVVSTTSSAQQSHMNARQSSIAHARQHSMSAGQSSTGQQTSTVQQPSTSARQPSVGRQMSSARQATTSARQPSVGRQISTARRPSESAQRPSVGRHSLSAGQPSVSVPQPSSEWQTRPSQSPGRASHVSRAASQSQSPDRSHLRTWETRASPSGLRPSEGPAEQRAPPRLSERSAERRSPSRLRHSERQAEQSAPPRLSEQPAELRSPSQLRPSERQAEQSSPPQRDSDAARSALTRQQAAILAARRAMGSDAFMSASDGAESTATLQTPSPDIEKRCSRMNTQTTSPKVIKKIIKKVTVLSAADEDDLAAPLASTSTASMAKASGLTVVPPSSPDAAAGAPRATEPRATTFQGEFEWDDKPVLGLRRQRHVSQVIRQSSGMPSLQGYLELTVVEATGLKQPAAACCEFKLLKSSATAFITQISDFSATPKWDYQVRVYGFRWGDSVEFVLRNVDTSRCEGLLGKAVLNLTQPPGFEGQLLLRETDQDAPVQLTIEARFVSKEEKIQRDQLLRQESQRLTWTSDARKPHGTIQRDHQRACYLKDEAKAGGTVLRVHVPGTFFIGDAVEIWNGQIGDTKKREVKQVTSRMCVLKLSTPLANDYPAGSIVRVVEHGRKRKEFRVKADHGLEAQCTMHGVDMRFFATSPRDTRPARSDSTSGIAHKVTYDESSQARAGSHGSPSRAARRTSIDEHFKVTGPHAATVRSARESCAWQKITAGNSVPLGDVRKARRSQEVVTSVGSRSCSPPPSRQRCVATKITQCAEPVQLRRAASATTLAPKITEASRDERFFGARGRASPDFRRGFDKGVPLHI